MNKKRGTNNEDHPRELASDENPFTSLKKPPLFNFLYLVVIGLCVAGITWFFRSGALQLWDRHPRPGEDYEYSWFVSLMFAVPGGFLVGSYLMGEFCLLYTSDAADDLTRVDLGAVVLIYKTTNIHDNMYKNLQRERIKNHL